MRAGVALATKTPKVMRRTDTGVGCVQPPEWPVRLSVDKVGRREQSLFFPTDTILWVSKQNGVFFSIFFPSGNVITVDETVFAITVAHCMKGFVVRKAFTKRGDGLHRDNAFISLA